MYIRLDIYGVMAMRERNSKRQKSLPIRRKKVIDEIRSIMRSQMKE